MSNYKEKECKIHGLTKYIKPKTKGSAWRCCKCRSEAVQRRREKLKAMAIEYKGGKCSKCGYDKCDAALDFHHLDPSQKEFALSKRGNTRAWSKMIPELDKCILVCSNCHREIHHGQVKYKK